MSAALAALALLTALAVQPAHAQHETRITASDGFSNDRFGWSVAISGDYLVVGAPYQNALGSRSGAAYVFVRSGSTWVQQAKLIPSDGSLNHEFGQSVAISSDYIVVGSRDGELDYQSGAAYVFARSGSTWGEQAKLTASDGAAGDIFGWSVAIDGDYLVVGAPGDDDMGSSSGSGYVFRRSGSAWVEQTKFVASDGSENAQIGRSVSINGAYAAIGGYGANDVGAAYVFARSGSTWTQQSKLTASDGAEGDWFGDSVSINGEYVIVGSSQDDDDGSSSGSAYIFRRIGAAWFQHEKIIAGDAGPLDRFGYDVAILGDHAIVGSPFSNQPQTDSGSSYMYSLSGNSWVERARLKTASTPSSSEQSGHSVALGADYTVSGAPGGGAVYVYRHGLITNLTNLSFSQVAIGADKTLPVEVDIIGASSAQVTEVFARDPDFGTTTAVPFTVNTGYPQTVDITFTPTRSGSYSSFLIFEHTGPSGLDSLQLYGIGVRTSLVPTPSLVAFGTVSTGNTSIPRNVQLARSSSISAITVSRVYSSDPAFMADVSVPFTVAGTPVDVPITFTPREGRPYDEWVYFEHDGTSGLDSVQVTGTGQFYARLTEFGTETTPTNFVNVLFRATGASGRGLDIPADYVAQHVDLFRVYDNNQEMDPTAPESFYQVLKLDEVPYSLRTVLLIDNSTSVGNDLDEIKEAAHLVVDNLAPSQELALYVFSSTWTQLEDFTDDRQALHAAIDGITLGGPSTALYTTLLEGLSRWDDLFTLTDLGNGQIDVDIDRGYLIALTDGEDQAGGATLAEVLAARGDKRVFTVGYGSVNTTVMQQLGNAGFFPVGDASQLPDAFAEVQEEIENDARSFYWLNYASPRRASQDWPLRICLRDNVYTGSGACAETTYNSTGFTDPLPGAFVNRSMQYLYGVEEVDVPENGVTLTATTILGLNPPVYEWTSSDASQVTVEPIAGTNQAIATRVGPVGGTATITLRDTANGFERTVNANLVVPTEEGAVPQAFALAAVYPNPAQGRVQVAYTVPAPVEVRLTLYDLLGRRVLTHEAAVAEGAHVATVETAALAAGVYVLRVEAGGAVATRRLTLVR